jgi:predicted Zn-ribbon and HTH transcriptional regulator
LSEFSKKVRLENLLFYCHLRLLRKFFRSIAVLLFHMQVKCKECGAFGHTARSRRCPIKCWVRTMVPLPMNTKKQKENQQSWKPPYCQKAGAFQQADRQKEQGAG